MPSDYNAICRDNIRRRGEEFDDMGQLISEQLYSDRSHFVYELLQNAEDALARRFGQNPDDNSLRAVRFRLFPDRLEFRHFGAPFNEEDVKGVSDVLKGTKKADVAQIGKFGIGFKSVYAFTASPEIHSGDEHFVIKRYIRPEAKAPNSACQIAKGETVFVFPFDHENLSQKKAFDLILDKLQELGPRVLLFLRRIDEIEWRVEPDGEKGQYLKESDPVKGSKIAHRVTVIGQRNGRDTEENWLTFERPVSVPNTSGQVFVEVGFRLETNAKQEESIKKIDRSPLVVYFPTKQDTKLGFLMQGPYRTTSSREHIQGQDDWNENLIKETAELVVEALRQLKEMGLLSVSLLETLPIEFEFEDKDSWDYTPQTPKSIYGEFDPIFKKVREVLMTEALLPANDGTFVSARNAKLVRGAELMKILNQEQLGALFQSRAEIKWLSSDITQNRTPALRSYLMQELDIEEVDPETFARNLSKQFLASQDDEWFIKFYEFLSDQRALWRPADWLYGEPGVLRDKPILRLQDGRHENPFWYDGSPKAYLAAGTDTETRLPIVKIELSRRGEVRQFLEALGIPELDLVEEVIKTILPKYTDTVDVSIEENKRDLLKIARAYLTDSQDKKSRLVQQLEETPFILAECARTGKTGYRKPEQVYLGSDELRMYFFENDSIIFLSSEYPDDVIPFLKELGVLDKIRIESRSEPGSTKDIDLASSRDYSWNHRRGLGGFDPDIDVDGLENALESPSTKRSEIIWNEIAVHYSHCIEGEILISSRQDFSPDASKYDKKIEVSKFGELLIETAWLPDSNGEMHKPCDLTLDDLPESFDRDERLADQLRMKKKLQEKLVEEAVKSFGFDSGEEAKEVAELKRKDPEGYKKWRESYKQRVAFPESPTQAPERRPKRIGEQYGDAPKKEYEPRERSDRTSRGAIDPTQQLREQYTNEDGQMICQICEEEMPFKKRDGEYYFEAVEAFSKDYLPKEHEVQFLALCPVCAARYKEFVKNDEDAMSELHRALKQSDELEVPLTLGEWETSIRFVETHRIDMKTILQQEQ